MTKQINKETPDSRLRKARKRAGFKSMNAFADAYDIPRGTYRAHEMGIRGMKDKIIASYAECLDIDSEWLKTGVVTDPVNDPDRPPPDKDIMEAAITLAETILEERKIIAPIKARTHMATEIYLALERQRKRGVHDNEVSIDLIDHLVSQVKDEVAKAKTT